MKNIDVRVARYYLKFLPERYVKRSFIEKDILNKNTNW